MLDLFVGRQPIFRKDLSLYAYELLFRGHGDSDSADVIDNDAATSQVLYNTFVEIGLNNIIGEHRAFVNLTAGFLMGEYPLPGEKDRLVLEILEHVKVTDALVDAVKDLKKQGYKIALDDFIYRPELKPLIPLANIIKIDLMALSQEQLRRYVTLLRDKTDAKLLAEKVETQQEYELCQELGFEFYQGYYFSKPNIVKDSVIPHNKITVLQLISKIQDPNLDIDSLDRIISMDASLTYKLLKLINSVSFNLSKEVDSIKSALILMGIEQVKNWATMLALSKFSDKPDELLVMALMRANMSYDLALKLGANNPDSYFTTGMLSILDTLLDQSMSVIVEQLPISAEIGDALLTHSGSIGQVVACVIDYEHGEWDTILKDSTNEEVLTHLQATYLQAVNDTNTQLQSIGS